MKIVIKDCCYCILTAVNQNTVAFNVNVDKCRMMCICMAVGIKMVQMYGLDLKWFY